MSAMLEHFDDLHEVSKQASGGKHPTLVAIVKNEMYFLPEFLSHYRNLGVRRFVFLDDQSDDGTREFLASQPDTVVVESKRRFGDCISVEDAHSSGVQTRRIDLIWRSLLMEKYCAGQWALHLDADEFLSLPKGMNIASAFSSFSSSGDRQGWCVMMDMYPETVSRLFTMREKTKFSIADTDWYFDGREHLRVYRKALPKKVYPGARARLHTEFDTNSKVTKLELKLRRILKLSPANYNAIRKPAFLNWRKGDQFLTSHSTSITTSLTHLFPLMHFKFSGPLAERAARAVQERQHPNDASEYADLLALLTKMKSQNSSFLGDYSVRFSHFHDFEKYRVIPELNLK